MVNFNVPFFTFVTTLTSSSLEGTSKTLVLTIDALAAGVLVLEISFARDTIFEGIFLGFGAGSSSSLDRSKMSSFVVGGGGGGLTVLVVGWVALCSGAGDMCFDTENSLVICSSGVCDFDAPPKNTVLYSGFGGMRRRAVLP